MSKLQRAMGRQNRKKGISFERSVARVMWMRGYWPVRRSVMLRDSHGHLSEIDVVAGWLWPVYIECKNYTSSVPLKDVAKFKEVLNLNGSYTIVTVAKHHYQNDGWNVSSKSLNKAVQCAKKQIEGDIQSTPLGSTVLPYVRQAWKWCRDFVNSV